MLGARFTTAPGFSFRSAPDERRLFILGYAGHVPDSNKHNTALGCLVVVGTLVCYFLWQNASDSGYVPHSALALVVARNWTSGEYKTCSEANVEAMNEEPQIQCVGSSFGDEPKRFKVRFYGATYKKELKDKASIIWRYRKNEGTDPAFTCDDQKVMEWQTP